MKRKISFVLCCLMLATNLAGCNQGGEAKKTDSAVNTQVSEEQKDDSKTPTDRLREKYPEPVVIKTVLGYRDAENPDTPDDVTPETQTAVKKFKEDLNIDLQYSWIVNSDQYDAKFGAELAAGNLPDVMTLSPNQFEDLASQGALGDLTEAYDLYANDSIIGLTNYDGELINVAKKDGKLFGLPNSTHPAQVTSQMYYRKDILEANGITELPKTISEFEALCDKLLTLDIDGNGKVGEPVMPANKWYIGAGLADFSPFFHAYNSWVSGWSEQEDGTLESPLVSSNVKESVTKLNEWYNKGYFAKDFAALDVWGANSVVISDIVAGKYAIVPGSWWIANWPLNDNKKNQPDAEWVVGPTITKDGETPEIMIPRYPVNSFTVVSRDCKNPEAIFKMINWSLEDGEKTSAPGYKDKATPEQLLEMNSYVYHWLPYRTWFPNTPFDNYLFVDKARNENNTEAIPQNVPENPDFWGVWDVYLKTMSGSEDPMVWGTYTSRLAPDGGVARMYEVFNTAKINYDEVYTVTPSMITKTSEMNKYVDTTILSMIMGQTPISDFDKFISEWNNLGGNDIRKEVNEWYANK